MRVLVRRSLAGALAVLGFGLMPYFGSASQTFPPTGANWTRSASSPVLSPSQAWEQTAVSEVARVISGVTWKMWYTGGWNNPGLGYATSSDGITWTHYASNPVYGQGGSSYANSAASSFVMTPTESGTANYYLYTSGGSSPTNIRTTFRVATSADGIAWTTAASSATLATGCTAWGNRVVWKESSTWYMLQEELTAGSTWAIYYYTSSDGLTWSIGNSGNALSTLQVHAGGMYGGPRFATVDTLLTPKVGSVYQLWFHAVNATGNLPTNIYHATSTDKITWTITPATPVLTYTGSGFEIDQVAGPVPVQVGTASYLYYDGDDNGSSAAKIGLALYP